MFIRIRRTASYLLASVVVACGESPSAPVLDDEHPASGLVISGYTISDLGTPLPCAEGEATGINEAGDIIVGQTCGIATVWYTDGGPVTLGALPGHTSSIARAVNNSGHIVGRSGTEAFLYTPAGGMVSIHDPTLLETSTGWAINNGDVVVGGGTTAGGIERGFRWTAAGGMQLLQLNDAWAYDVNDSGTIVGYDDQDNTGVIWSGMLVTKTGTMGGLVSVAFGVNDAGYVVGESQLDDLLTWHAFRYSPSPYSKKFVDLGPASTGWSRAYKISDLGRIVGIARPDPDQLYIHDAATWYQGASSYLPDLGGSASARDVSRCGTIVGNARTATGDLKRPVRWDRQSSDCGRL